MLKDGCISSLIIAMERPKCIVFREKLMIHCEGQHGKETRTPALKLTDIMLVCSGHFTHFFLLVESSII